MDIRPPEPVRTGRSGTARLVGRPVLALVLNALIVLAGLAALQGVEVRELPEVESPVVTVTAAYDGAAPETIDREVTAVIEGAVGRVAGVRSISSSSRFGQSRVTVEFQSDVDLDTAATDVRDAVARISNTLPDGVDPPRTVKADPNAQAVMRIAVTSPRRSAQDLTELVRDRIEDRLLAAPGVADVEIYGGRDEVLRVDVNQMQLASRGLTIADVARVLRDSSFDAPAGSMSAASQTILVRATSALATAGDFAALEVAPEVRLGDVAQVAFGPAPGASYLRANNETGIGLGILRQARSNTLEISRAVRAVVAEAQEALPEDVSIFVSSDTARFIESAIHEVEIALVLSVLIVTLIIFVFLRDARATMIPILTIPVSLLGTLAAIWAAGFSVNILTLLALVLATGLVVDDAIVVLENIMRRRADGMSPAAAAVLGTDQVFFAVVATTTTLAAVFVPLAFLPGQTGGLFREFGFTLAIAVLISAVSALTLAPVLSAGLLRPHRNGDGGIGGWVGSRLAALYGAVLRASLGAPFIVLGLAAALAATAAFLYPGLRQELTPPEDRSIIFLSIQAPQGVALDYTDGKMRDIEAIIAPYRESGEAGSLFSIAGQGATNRGFMVLTLIDSTARTRSQAAIAEEITGKLRGVIGIRATASQPNSLGIRGAGQGLSFAVVGQDYAVLAGQAESLIDRIEADPRFGDVRLGYDTTQAQLFVEVDRARAADLGVEVGGLGEALQAVLDGRTAGRVFEGDRSFDIRLLSTSDPVDDPGDLERVFVRAGDGQMIPISSFVDLTERAVAPELAREAQARSVPVSASLTPGLPLGQALAELRAIAAEVLPETARVVPLGEARTLEESNRGIGWSFGFAVVIVFLVLAAQFESLLSALVVMATVPLGLACAVFALVFTGGSLNIYSQVGLVLLVGIMAKNGILVVEFANQLRERGAGVREAAEGAAMTRLRPVMMTMLATVLGALPLILGTGAGAEARAAIGWIVVGGLGFATVSTLILTPVAYLLLAGFARPGAGARERLERELGEVGGGGTTR
ncbi:MAG: efflux RND transporter permease subunit [Paracoccaceae bacterium]